MAELIPTASNAVAAARKKRQGVAPIDKPIDGVTNFKQTPTGGATLEYQGKPMTLQGPTSGGQTTTTSPISKPTTASTPSTSGVTKPLPTEPTGRFETNGDQGATPYMKADGTFDPAYVPKSEDEIMKLPIDDYTRQNYLRNFYASKGLNFDPASTPKSFDEEASIFLENQAKKKSAFEQEAAEATKNLAEQKAGQKSYNDMSMTSNREGVVSQGNAMTRDQVDLAMESRYNSKMRNLQQLMDDLNMQLTSQQGKFIAGREDQIRAQMKSVADSMTALEKQQAEKEKGAMDYLKLLSDNGALANLDPDTVKYLEEAMPGAPPGVVQLLSQAATQKYGTEQQKQQLENATKSVGMMQNLVQSGVVLTPEAMMSFAKQTGLPMEAIYGFNQAAQQVMNDKTLDQTTKTAQLQKLGYDLDRQARGITNAELEKVDYLAQMYKNGASQEEIAMAKKVMGIKDADDPMYNADLKLKQAQAAIEEKKLRGEPITIDDQLKLLEAQQDYGDMGGYSDIGGGVSGEMVISNKAPQAGIKISTENGEFKVTVPPNTQFQCGAYVNRVWGDRVFASEGTQKMAQIDKYGFRVKGTSAEELAQRVKPGMAFVMPIANNKYDHVGLVAKTLPDGIITNEANANGRATTNSVGPGANNITSRFIPWSQLYGFMAPPSSKSVGGTPASAPGVSKLGLSNLQSLTTKEIRDGFENGTYDLNQLTPKAFDQVKKVLGEDKIKELQSGGREASNEALQTAQDIMSSYSGLTLTDLPVEQRASVAKELNKLKKQAFEDGDTLGVIKASAGGKPLDATALQSLEKARMVSVQLADLGTQIESNPSVSDPIMGVLNSSNPYNTKAQEIKAKLHSLIPSLARGVYGEVGVLTDQDIDNYSKTIGNLNSTAEVNKVLMDATKKLVTESIKKKLDTQARAGRDVSGFADLMIELDPSTQSSTGGSRDYFGGLANKASSFFGGSSAPKIEDSHGDYYIPQTNSNHLTSSDDL